jgi:hypothetical protein
LPPKRRHGQAKLFGGLLSFFFKTENTLTLGGKGWNWRNAEFFRYHA